ncbi:hypothetical protein [Lacrimispora sphenoides]|uniref:Uncharacterized protein n=1 Tax=Lacrimispora sphenoides JCM 1415 TaxID=1297793 RepID=A0ABY1CCY0_9FIRM|nr:hypothetical protein [Lacrimispora sphenoides]SET92746.1 hypothetical protein SAMN02745906_3080 [[Clostridium] sphenoides JCM 1415]SUY52423.1 Uncharacterised protein [Lacrimispora sphenoides]
MKNMSMWAYFSAFCILPQTLNTMLSNCKKKYTNHSKWSGQKEDLPLGVRHNVSMKKYYSVIKLRGTNNVIKLAYRDTSEEAFAEYKMMKQADILVMAAKYKNKIPKHINKNKLRLGRKMRR